MGDFATPVISAQDIAGLFSGVSTDAYVPVCSFYTGDKLIFGGTIRNTGLANSLSYRLTFQRYGIDVADVVSAAVAVGATLILPLISLAVGGVNMPVLIGPLSKIILEVISTVPGSPTTFQVEPVCFRCR
jgi:hypothetical protein